MKKSQGFYKNVTLIDVQLASVYYAILVDLAKHKHSLTYSELVERAKSEYPDRHEVKNAISVSTGRRLDVVRMFTSERELPDLTSLVINKGTGECGVGFTQNFDPVATREKVFAFDWSSVSSDFDGFVVHTENAIKPKVKRKEMVALELMASYHKKNKNSLPSSISTQRDLIIRLLMEGYGAPQAFDEALKHCHDQVHQRV